MTSRKRKILITGPPGIGKTTVIRKIAKALGHLQLAGFYTSEIRRAGIRQGFELIDLGGRRLLLAHVDIGGPFRVSKYGVDIAHFEKYLDEMDFIGNQADLLIIDEIGKMECFSEKFLNVINLILEAPRALIGSIAMKGTGPINSIKKHRDVQLVELSHHNRNTLADEIISLFLDHP